MRTRNIAFLSFVAAGMLTAGCGRSPAQACADDVAVICDRQHECASDELRESEAFVALYGTSAQSCRATYGARRGCDAIEDEAALCSGDEAGLSWNEDEALACDEARRAQTCVAFTDPAKTPESCRRRCAEG